MGINLVGPVGGQPFDIATQQAQLQKAQDLAMSLINQGMESSPAVIHTGGNNPFARDVVNLAPIGKVIATAFGKSNLEDLNQKQQALANSLLQQYKDDVTRMWMPRLENGQPSVMGTKSPTMLQSAQTAIDSTNPQVRALGALILGHVAEGEKARQFTPANTSALARANVDPASIHLSQGDFGYPMQTQADINALRLLPEKVTTSPLETTTLIPRGAAARADAAAAAAAEPPAPAPAAGSAPPPPVTKGAGTIVAPNTAVPAVAADTTEQVKSARADQAAIHNFVSQDMQRNLDMIKLAQMAQVQKTTGALAEEKNLARKVALTLGFTNDDASKVTNYETLMKMALTPAAHAGREEVGGRYTQLEFMQFLKAGAASGITDPRTAQNIFTQRLLDGFTNLEQFRHKTLPALAASPGVPASGILPSLSIGVPSSMDLADKAIPSIEAPKGAQPIHVTYDPHTHTWHNAYATDPQAPVGATPTPAKLPGGFTLVQ